MSTAAPDVSKTKAWLMAARPQTLPAGSAPVIIGVGLAIHDEVLAVLPAVAALVGALLIQIGTNFANDYFDAVKGTDAPDREGFTRVTAGGLIPPRQVKAAMAGTYTLALVVGLYLVAIGGGPILIVGLSSIVAGLLYTGGPYPYGYYGLGDLFVFVYFGVVAVTGTYYVQAVATMDVGLFPIWLPAGSLTLDVVIASLPAAGLSTAILVVNNIRDIEEDRAAGKRSLAVIIGYRWSRVEYVLMTAMAYVVPLALWLFLDYEIWVVLPVATIPLALSVTRTVLDERGGQPMNEALERTGQLMAIHALLFAIGLSVSTVI